MVDVSRCRACLRLGRRCRRDPTGDRRRADCDDPDRPFGPERPDGTLGFTLAFPLRRSLTLDDVALEGRDANGTWHRLDDPARAGLADDAYRALFLEFADRLAQRQRGTILEIGSRGTEPTSTQQHLPDGWDYVGLDLREGPNVDVVGDIHDLRAAVGRRRFDAVVAMSVLEHVAMPWLAVLELNRILRSDGLVLFQTHQTFPLHEMPCDYWRFSNDAWFALLNPRTGFVIESVGMGEPASIVPRFSHSIVQDNQNGLAFLGAGVIARQVGRTRLRWPVNPTEVMQGTYPS